MAFCSSCGNQLGDGERFCSKCGADQMAKAGGAPTAAPAQYFHPAGMVPVAAMPPAAGMQGQDKVWYAGIAAAALFALFHLSGPSGPQQQQQGGAQINLIFVVSEDLAYQSSGDVNADTA